MVCAMSSLPVPDSPAISTDARCRRRLLDDAVDRANAGTVADDPAEAALLAQLAAKLPHFAQRLLPFHRLLQQDLQPLRIDRLAQIVVGAFFDSFDRTVDSPLRRQQDEREVGELILERVQQLESAHPRHDEIADDDRRAEGGHLPHRGFALGRFVGEEAPGLHELGEAGPGRRIVLDDKNPLGCVGLRLRNF